MSYWWCRRSEVYKQVSSDTSKVSSPLNILTWLDTLDMDYSYIHLYTYPKIKHLLRWSHPGGDEHFIPSNPYPSPSTSCNSSSHPFSCSRNIKDTLVSVRHESRSHLQVSWRNNEYYIILWTLYLQRRSIHHPDMNIILLFYEHYIYKEEASTTQTKKNLHFPLP